MTITQNIFRLLKIRKTPITWSNLKS